MAARELGIDLGTVSVLVYQKKKGIILSEPSVVAISKKANKVVAVGNEARKMVGRTPEDIYAIKPLKDGVIADYTMTSIMLKEFIRKIVPNLLFNKPIIVIGVPASITSVEKRAIIEAGYAIGAKKIILIIEPMAAALGAGLDIDKPKGNMIVDIGGGTTDIAIISMNGIVVRDTVRIAGNAFDEDIIRYIKKNMSLIVGDNTAEEIKKQVGKAYPDEENNEIQIIGRDTINGLPKEVTINSDAVYDSLKEHLNTIISHIKLVLEKTPPELISDVMNDGIVVTGGGALLRGIDKLIYKYTGVKTSIADDPITCVARGTGKVFEDSQLLKRLMELYEDI